MRQYVYIIFVLFAGIGYFFNSESISISVGLSGIFAPFIAWFGGSGMRGAFNLGDKKQIIIAIVLGIICLAVSIYWIQLFIIYFIINIVLSFYLIVTHIFFANKYMKVFADDHRDINK